MVEFGVSGGNGVDNSPLQSSSVEKSPLPLMDTVPPSYHAYPPPLTTYVEIVGSSTVFMDTLKKLHAAMGTKFMIPVVGGRELDLYKLFVEVTSRGGIFKVMKEKRWKEVTAAFNFPSSATNASFIIRKYYVSLLYHYEQIYLFKAKYWTPLPSDSLQNATTLPPLPQVVTENVLPMSQETYAAPPQQQATVEATEVAASSSLTATVGSQVYGVIDGKFDSGYLITVKIGAKDYKGVLYQASPANAEQISPNQRMELQTHTLTKLGLPRRKRRKKCEIRKRDPAHPKPNRSGYNFFFAEQHARLKPLYSGRDREISRMIGELWNKLQEPERAVYQEKAQRDKERYKTEMEDYRERLKTGQIINKAIHQSPLVQDLNLADFDVNLEFEGTTSAYIEENGTSNMEEDEVADKNLKIGQFSHHDTELKNVNMEMLGDEAFQLQTGLEKNISSRGDAADEISTSIKEGLVKSSNDDEQVRGN